MTYKVEFRPSGGGWLILTWHYIYIYGRRQNFGNWKKGSTWAGKQLRRAGAVFFHNSVLLIKMHTSKIGNTLYTEPFWKGRDVLQLNFHIYIFSMWGCFLAYDHFHNYLFPERGDNFSIDMFPEFFWPWLQCMIMATVASVGDQNRHVEE